jgi:hypothetical protein
MNREIDDLECEIAETRADLDDALDMLHAKLSPSALIGEAFGHVRQSAPSVSAGIGNMYAHRPFTALLMTAGMNWFLSRRAEKRAREDDREWQAYHPDDRHRVREIAKRARARVKSSAARVRTRAADMVHGAEERAAHAGESLHHMKDASAERLHHAADTARERGRNLRERGQHMGERARETARAGKSHVTSDVQSFVARQPLLAGAIALVVGAAIASAIPPTPVERKAVRPLAGKAQRLKHKAAEKIVEGVERGTSMAAEALDNATTKIEESLPGRPAVH